MINNLLVSGKNNTIMYFVIYQHANPRPKNCVYELIWYLFFEVSDGVLVSERQKVEDAVTDVVVFQVVHHVCSIALGETATSIGGIQYPSMHCKSREVCIIYSETCQIPTGHKRRKKNGVWFNNMSPCIQVCESQSKYRVSIAQWVKRWHGSPEAQGSSPG